MSESLLDLYSRSFWIAVAAAVLLLTPLATGPARKWTWMLVNLAFLVYLLKIDVVPVLVAIVAVYVILKLLASGWLSPLPAAMAGGAALALFIVHKLPGPAESWGLGRCNPILSAIGYSYVVLRAIDAGRAVAAGMLPAPDLPSTVNYLLPFHMLAAGPIQAYSEFVAQPAVPEPLSASDALRALERIAGGLLKKFVLANMIERIFLTGFRTDNGYILVEMQFYYLWLYLDFSAYTDIAVGIGRLLGVATPENFRRPYLARNVIDFWDRWHISLSHFIRRNLFIPIQVALMRRSDGERPLLAGTIAFLVSFLLCGLWHGIEWRWLAWGAFHACGLIVCNFYKAWLTRKLGAKGVRAYLANPWIRAIAIFATFEFVAVSLVIISHPWGAPR